MKKKKIYFALIDDGLSWRCFRSLPLVCELFGLDYNILRIQLNEKGYWIGMRMTIFATEVESRQHHKGRL